MSCQKHRHRKRGFSLMEILVALGVFAIFSVGIYSSIQFIFKVVYQSRIKIIGAGIANEQIEVIRNIPYQDIGLINGSPSGVLAAQTTTTRNGLSFSIARTIRNIDDPFDGIIGGSPNDSAPADYKLVEISVLCSSCNQTTPVILSTHVAPKYLEGDETKGTLFIRVLNASGQPVPGATVHVISTSTTTTIDITDVTNNSGLLSLIDLPPALSGYHITVTKSGYTTDQTVAPSQSNPNPVKPPVSVIAQSVSEASFMIDQVSSLSLAAINNACVPMAGIAARIGGTKLIGMDPDVWMVSTTVTTDGSGQYYFSDYGWDAYNVSVSSHDVIGAIPMLPVTVQPGASQPVQLLLGTNSSHSLLVGVRDSITLQPISNATVQVSGTGYDQTKVTGVGHIRQTDWSQGTGQENMLNEAKYFSDDGRVSNSAPSGSITLKKVGSTYYTSGMLESSTFDLGLSANYISLVWEPLSQPAQTGNNPVLFQLATSNSSTPAQWDFFGPDGTTSTFYTATSSAIHEVHDGDQFVRYRAYLASASTGHTPTISDITLSYTNSCSAPGQTYFGALANQQYSVQVSKTGYQTNVGNVTASGDTRLIIDLTEL